MTPTPELPQGAARDHTDPLAHAGRVAAVAAATVDIQESAATASRVADATCAYIRGESVSSVPADLPVMQGFEVLGVLGRGGMGVVYKARQVGLNRLVALKMILAGGHAGTYERQRFKTEGEAVAALQHPNIVQVYDVGDQDGLPYFSLEFCDGGSL